MRLWALIPITPLRHVSALGQINFSRSCKPYRVEITEAIHSAQDRARVAALQLREPFRQDPYIRNLADYLFQDRSDMQRGDMRKNVYGHEQKTQSDMIRHC
ncbi:hypothetical protein E2P81_ATG09820 [Venturia nashicola]|nr:hypothetical protein E2P81_ATG09820 [Venturia nashicola]